MFKSAVAASLLVFACAIAQAANNPIPTLTSLSPASVYADGPSFTLTVQGTGFVPSTVIYWEFEAPLATTYVSSTEVTAQVPSAYISQQTNVSVYAYNPPPGGGNSGDLNLSVVALDPTISYLAPISVVAGSGATSLTVSGANFMNGASILLNGKQIPTTYTNSGQLQGQLTVAQVTKPEISQISVSNPAPGGVSTTLNFDVTYPATIRILNIPANDLIWDPVARRIYASLPSSFGENGNSIAVINPINGNVLAYHFAGSEPNQLAISSDSAYLYVGLNGSGSVQRFLLPSFTPDINVSLGTSEFSMNLAGAIQVSPGDSHTFAVALSGCCDEGGALEFFTDAKLLPNSITYPYTNSMQFASASTMYAYSSGTLMDVTVNSSGGTLSTQWSDFLEGASIEYDAGLIYSSEGQVFNPATGELVGSYDVAGNFSNANDLLPESAINSTFVVGISPFFNSLGITSYNLAHFTPSAVIDLSQLVGGVTPSFISWGNNGLAFVTNSGCCESEALQTVLVQSAMMETKLAK
jgi:trimeric autotransporter adhesin